MSGNIFNIPLAAADSLFFNVFKFISMSLQKKTKSGDQYMLSLSLDL